ncbi:hypothetical protein Tco_1506376 [Tanacetum coccineum]
MQISYLMNAHRCPELAKRSFEKVTRTMDEMIRRLDEFVHSEEAYTSTELPRGKVLTLKDDTTAHTNDKPMRASSGGDRRQYDHRFSCEFKQLGRIELEVYFEDEGLIKGAKSYTFHHSLRDEIPHSERSCNLGQLSDHHIEMPKLKRLLKNNQDVFVWQPSDMTGVPGRIIEHNLVSIQPVSQKRRVVLAPERSEAVTNEVAE